MIDETKQIWIQSSLQMNRDILHRGHAMVAAIILHTLTQIEIVKYHLLQSSLLHKDTGRWWKDIQEAPTAD